jgi:hypothetical protein
MPSRPIYIVPWGARLHHRDNYFSKLKLPKQFLADRSGRNFTKAAHVQWRQTFRQELIHNSYWVCEVDFACMSSLMV